MKHSITAATCLSLAMVIQTPAFADQIFEIEVPDASDDAVVCVGDEQDAARFGGVPVREGRAIVSVPVKDAANRMLEQVIITASNGEQAGRYTLRAEVEPIRIRLNDDASGPCTPEGLVPIETIKEAYFNMAREMESDVMARLREMESEVSRTTYRQMLSTSYEAASSANKSAEYIAVIPTSLQMSLIDNLPEGVEVRPNDTANALKNIMNILAAAAVEYEARQRREAERREEEARAREAELEAQREAARKAEAAPKKIEEYCFGALGSKCGKLGWEIHVSSCHPNLFDSKHTCLVNVGSWLHDECCVVPGNEQGFFCAGAGGNDRCSSSFWLGAGRFLTPYNWWRKDVDARYKHTTPTVEKHRFCAKPGTVILKEDAHRCCNSSAGLNFWDAAAFTGNHGAWAFTLPDARKCT